MVRTRLFATLPFTGKVFYVSNKYFQFFQTNTCFGATYFTVLNCRGNYMGGQRFFSQIFKMGEGNKKKLLSNFGHLALKCGIIN